MKGQRHIGGGRPEVRVALYMAAVTASRFNPILKAFYTALIGRNKPAKVALTAVMRKLVIHMNSELKKMTATALVVTHKKTEINKIPVAN